jgi:DNA-directed RNA polymerase I, II, and III subunit RPABC2
MPPKLTKPRTPVAKTPTTTKATKTPTSTPQSETLPDLETIPEETAPTVPNKYLYKPTVETKTIYVHPDARVTSEVMTEFEYNHIVGIRAQQLANELKSFTEIGDLSDPIAIAKLEIANKKCPLSIKRVRTNFNSVEIAEYWEVNEMAIPF